MDVFVNMIGTECWPHVTNSAVCI